MVEDDIRSAPHEQSDFLGAFAVIETEQGILMVKNHRVIAGVEVFTWDLPGGQVEPGEELHAALSRELMEEVRLEVAGTPEFLFVQEGVRTRASERIHAWRSFFFRVEQWSGEPTASAEVLDCGFKTRGELGGLLNAPYHDSFLRWLTDGGELFSSSWDD